MMQNSGNKRSVQKCAHKAGSYVLKTMTASPNSLFIVDYSWYKTLFVISICITISVRQYNMYDIIYFASDMNIILYFQNQ